VLGGGVREAFKVKRLAPWPPAYMDRPIEQFARAELELA
jgi:hypothetical protein